MPLGVSPSLRGGVLSCTALGGGVVYRQFRGSDEGSQESQGRGAGEEPVQGRWHQLRGKGEWLEPIDEERVAQLDTKSWRTGRPKAASGT